MTAIAVLESPQDSPRLRDMHEQSVAAIALAISAVATVFGGQIAEESARTVVEKRFAAVNRHDLDAIVALYAPDAVDVSPDFCADRSGPEGARRTYRELFQAYPNVTADPTVSIVEGHRVAVQFFARAGRRWHDDPRRATRDRAHRGARAHHAR